MNHIIIISLGLCLIAIFIYIIYILGDMTISVLPFKAFFISILIYINTLRDNTLKLWDIPENGV